MVGNTKLILKVELFEIVRMPQKRMSIESKKNQLKYDTFLQLPTKVHSKHALLKLYVNYEII